MITITKDNVEMVVSQEDYDLVYKNAGWEQSGSADVQLEGDTGKRVKVESDTEFVAGPTELQTGITNEGETIVEDSSGKPTKLGKERSKQKSEDSK